MSGVDLSQYDDEQVRLMEEMCIVVDRDDKVLGFDTKKNCHLMTRINEGLLHRAFSVFLFNSKGELLLQQRADEKITFPGYFTNTCCSHPLNKADELEQTGHIGVKRAAQRKLEHELGIPADQVPLDKFQFMTRIHYLAASDGMWGEHEVDYIFMVQADVDLAVNPNEVKSVRYLSRKGLEEFLATAESEGLPITPWFRLVVQNFLFKWWGKLGQEADAEDVLAIHHM